MSARSLPRAATFNQAWDNLDHWRCSLRSLIEECLCVPVPPFSLLVSLFERLSPSLVGDTRVLSCPVFAEMDPRQVFPFSNLSAVPPAHYLPKSFPLMIFADPHPLNPVDSIFYKNIGGGGHLQ